jgi:two-component system sensor histidine kinase QseC
VRSIRSRLALGLVAGLALLLGAGATALYLRAKSDLESQADATLASKAWALASALHADEGEIQFELPPALAAGFERADRWAAYEIHRKDGRLFAHSESLGGRELAAPRSSGREPELTWIELEPGKPARRISFTVPVLNEDPSPRASSADGAPARDVLDDLTIDVAEDRTDTRAVLAAFRTTILAVITLAFLASAALVHFGLRRGLAPLEAMAADVQRIDARTLDARLPKEPLPAELEAIRDRLNELFDRLQQSFERERRFNAAVAHELRTPIAELRALSEIALRWPERADLARNMSEVAAVAQEMQAVIEALLTLRRVESGTEAVELAPVDAGEIVRGVVAAHAKAATESDQTIDADLGSESVIDSQAAMLRSIVSNLVSNAIEYSPRGSRIEIECRVANGRFHLSTRNPAPDLGPSDVPHLFDAFWRKDAVRTSGSHVGLGLTLTRSLATVLGLELAAELESGGTLRMALEKPVPAARRAVAEGARVTSGTSA